MNEPINPAVLAQQDRSEYLADLRADLGEEKFAAVYGQAVQKPQESLVADLPVLDGQENIEIDPTPLQMAAPDVAPTEPVVAPIEPVAATPILVAPTPAVAAELPEQRYEYQPTDAEGRPLGGKQVLKYRTQDELLQKFEEQNVLLQRRLREVTRNQRLGITEEAPFPDGIERLPEFIQFKARELTTEEKFQLSQDLQDPTKVESAAETLIECMFGATPAELRKKWDQQQIDTAQAKAIANFQSFDSSEANFYADEENVKTLTSWMSKNGLHPTRNNFKLAYDRLSEAGLFHEAPIVREEISKPAPVVLAPEPVAAPVPEIKAAESQPPVAPVTRISEQPQPQPKRQPMIPSGLNSRSASAAGPAPENGRMTLAEIDRMSFDEYKRRAKNDPNFLKLVDSLEADKAKRR